MQVQGQVLEMGHSDMGKVHQDYDLPNNEEGTQGESVVAASLWGDVFDKLAARNAACN